MSLIVDTAGRLAIDEPMMQEIAALHAALQPAETLFVVDAMQGQDAVNVARAFSERLPLTGVVLTKLDGDSRGGAALSVRHVTGKPIKFAGVGEKLTGLEPFHPERMASRILGMGDILSLVEEAHKQVDLEEAQKLADKVRKGKGFDLEDFKQQMQQMNKMGGMASLMDKLPAQLAGQINPAQLQDDKQFARIEGIINSMTPQERAQPELIKASRKRRIAAGAGVHGAGSQPAAQPVRADAEDDEDDEGRQPAAHDARHEGHAAGHALAGQSAVISEVRPCLPRSCPPGSVPRSPPGGPADVAALLERVARPGNRVLGLGFARADQFLVGGADVAVLHHALDDGVGDVALVALAVEFLQQHGEQIILVDRLRRERVGRGRRRRLGGHFLQHALVLQQPADDHAGRVDEGLGQLLQAFENVLVHADGRHTGDLKSKRNTVTLFTLL